MEDILLLLSQQLTVLDIVLIRNKGIVGTLAFWCYYLGYIGYSRMKRYVTPTDTGTSSLYKCSQRVKQPIVTDADVCRPMYSNGLTLIDIAWVVWMSFSCQNLSVTSPRRLLPVSETRLGTWVTLLHSFLSSVITSLPSLQDIFSFVCLSLGHSRYQDFVKLAKHLINSNYQQTLLFIHRWSSTYMQHISV